MASYTAPTPEQIVALTGLNQFIRNDSGASFGEWLETLVPQAEAEVAVTVDATAGDGSFDGEWSTRKAQLLTQAVAYYAAAAALLDPELRVATGTNEPYIIEDSEAIAAVAERLRERGADLASLVTSGVKAEPAFAMPSVGASTFDTETGDRGPIEKNELLDERDGVGAWDTVNG